MNGVKTLPRLPAVRDLVKIYGLTARQRLSQNFILDKNVTDKIVKSVNLKPSEFVVEIGPGPGLLTRSILDMGVENVVVVERDERFLPTLKQLADASDGRLKILHGNMLTINHDDILRAANVKDTAPLHLLGNLPFNIATPLLLQWLHRLHTRSGLFSLASPAKMTLMFQKEVGERICAEPGRRERGRLSVMSQAFCEVKRVYDVANTVFVPKPKVDAAVIQFLERQTTGVKYYDALEDVARYFFTHRRKTIGHISKKLKGIIPQFSLPEEWDPMLRPEDLSTEQFIMLSGKIGEMGRRLP
ncbi:uncharacterized protein VTP21DRAFT_1594 [Calcarisporiella thermophila]|uniref:uncharacterized protein n=1 Tax=Calcarisporiella thermophila TaxID=911321 RepID=UPI0037422108